MRDLREFLDPVRLTEWCRVVKDLSPADAEAALPVLMAGVAEDHHDTEADNLQAAPLSDHERGLEAMPCLTASGHAEVASDRDSAGTLAVSNENSELNCPDCGDRALVWAGGPVCQTCHKPPTTPPRASLASGKWGNPKEEGSHD